jgi:hypothetical protein
MRKEAKRQEEDEHRLDVDHVRRANQVPSVHEVVNHIRGELHMRKSRVHGGTDLVGILGGIADQDDLAVKNGRHFLDIQDIHERIVGEGSPCAFELMSNRR